MNYDPQRYYLSVNSIPGERETINKRLLPPFPITRNELILFVYKSNYGRKKA